MPFADALGRCAALALAVVTTTAGVGATAQTVHEPWHASGPVGRVYDGDTFDLATRDRGVIRVRFSGIDAPERGQAYSRRATEFLQALVRGKTVDVTCFKDDGNNREVCDVRVDSLDVGLQMLQAGLAWHFKRFAAEQSPDMRAAYAEAEEQAQKAQAGLWRNPDPMPPWECRRARREGGACR